MVFPVVADFFVNGDQRFLGVFAFSIGLSTTFEAEMWATMKAIEIVVSKGWPNLWLETNSCLLIHTYNKKTVNGICCFASIRNNR